MPTPRSVSRSVNPIPNPRMMPVQRAFSGEVEVDPLVRPSGCNVGGAADRCRAAAHDDHRGGGSQPVVCSAQLGADLSGRLQRRRRQKPLLTPVEMTSASYSSAIVAPSSPRPKTVRAARSSPVRVA